MHFNTEKSLAYQIGVEFTIVVNLDGVNGKGSTTLVEIGRQIGMRIFANSDIEQRIHRLRPVEIGVKSKR